MHSIPRTCRLSNKADAVLDGLAIADMTVEHIGSNSVCRWNGIVWGYWFPPSMRMDLREQLIHELALKDYRKWLETQK